MFLNGATLGDFSVYDKFDYLIQIDAPFVEREKRVIQRKDIVYDKNTMVNRDLDFRQAQNRRKREGKRIDLKIENIGSKEDLQKIADRIYYEQIVGKKQKVNETMQDKYGGYKIRTPKMIVRSKGGKGKEEQSK